MKRNVLIFYGGQSVEHDISIITGLQTLDAARQDKENYFSTLEDCVFTPVYISRGGGWYVGKGVEDIEGLKKFHPLSKQVTRVSLVTGEPLLAKYIGKKLKPFLRVDVAILCNHGKGGEDGMLQALLEASMIPYTSSGILGSAVCMDKISTKYILKANDFPQTKFVTFHREEWRTNPEHVMQKVEALGYPVVVKPSNLGSSIGISICTGKESFLHAVEVASKFDFYLLAEQAVPNLREFNCSVMGNSMHSEVSDIEEPVGWKEFLSFEDKYLSNKKESGMGSSKHVFPAQIDSELKQNIQTLSKKAFHLLGCKGVVRIDFLFNNETKELFINEINTIPGSMSNYFWKKEKISYPKLISKLIDYASEEFNENKKNTVQFSSNALEHYTNTKKMRTK